MPVQDVLADSAIVSIFVALSLMVALVFEMPKPYWVPMSCYVIMLGMNFQSIWTKLSHRLVGTGVGILLAWLLLLLSPDAIGVAMIILR